ncbi:flagellar biosynthetic protein FliR [Geobacter sp. DSM 9736]|uniref:flagellar biosynthetic protein FliR n=1 Tax=Geobacter sp. DSM 9736 TaxID=1277350 RepID=UPI000B5131A9|nr:flagellar biosynthetic protein FliR [Geobacter sp. DSM 9736]SNB47046.1 flagellar biosynthetic protein FliR [Geobacter sp. DSM 9736]
MGFTLPFSTLNEFTLFTLILGRMAGIFTAIPLFGGKAVPAKIKMAVILAMALTLHPILRLGNTTLPTDPISLVLLVVCETLIGLALGLVSQTIFTAVEFCGQVIGMQMGLTIATMFDPTMGHQVSTMAAFQNLLAMLLFMTLGVHHIFIRSIVESYQLIPIGGWHISGELVSFIIDSVGNVFILGIKLAAPVMVALLATSVVLGIMARSFPQMNIFMVSMPLNIGVGFLILGLSLLVFLHTLQNAFGGVGQHIKALYKLLGT